jgi:hypothetical protein
MEPFTPSSLIFSLLKAESCFSNPKVFGDVHGFFPERYNERVMGRPRIRERFLQNKPVVLDAKCSSRAALPAVSSSGKTGACGQLLT